MDQRAASRHLRCTTSGHAETNRLDAIISAKPAGEFKADQRPEAVAEECKRHVQQWDQSLRKSFDQRGKSRERTLHKPCSASRELNRTDLDISWQAVRPGAKNRCTRASIRKTEQTATGMGS